jgi:hypothetical protein
VANAWPTEYDEATCQTAGELRAAGIEVPANVPDCGWIPRGSMTIGGKPVVAYDAKAKRIKVAFRAVFTVPFRWIAFVVETPVEKEKNDG